jgi:predicted Zn-dependent protease with MMP-like domain
VIGVGKLYLSTWIIVNNIRKRVDIALPGSLVKGEWREELHPRDERGRFTSKPGGEGPSKPKGTRARRTLPSWAQSYVIHGVRVSYSVEDWDYRNGGQHGMIEGSISKALANIPEEHRALIKDIVIDDDITNDKHPITGQKILSEEELRDTHNGLLIGGYALPDVGRLVFNGSADLSFFEGRVFGNYINIVLHEMGHLVLNDLMNKRIMFHTNDEENLTTIRNEIKAGPRMWTSAPFGGNEMQNMEEIFSGLYRNYILRGAFLKERLPKSYDIMKRLVFNGREYLSKAVPDVVPLYIYRAKSGARIYSLKPLPGLAEDSGE